MQEIKNGIDRTHLKFFDDEKHEWRAESGKFKLYVGASSADIRSVAEFVYE